MRTVRMLSPALAVSAILGLAPAVAVGGSWGAPQAPPECNPFASSEERLFPYPSRFFQVADPGTATGVRNAYPRDALETPAPARPIDFSAFNRLDGHSPAAPMLVHFGVDVAPEFLVDQRSTVRSLEADAPIALFNLDTGARVPILTEMDQNLRSERTAGRHPLIIRPLAPMAMGARHLAVLTTALRDRDGDAIPTPPGFAVLRDGLATTDPHLEGARADYDELFAFLSAN